MQLNMNVAGARPAPIDRQENLIRERLRAENSRLQMKIISANKRAEMAKQTEADLARVTEELNKAKKTIADLNAKVRSLTSKLDKKFKENKETREEDKSEIKISVP